MPVSSLASYGATRALLDAYGLSAKYTLGQNFLIDDAIVGKICALAQPDPTDVVLEVGPGIGTLTVALLPRVAAVVAVETDADMEGPLGSATADYSERLALVHADALRVTPSQLAAALDNLVLHGLVAATGHKLPNRWISNLPYAVAATLILKYFQEWPFIEDATVMVQSEVADRICAGPGSKIYGAYTLKLALFARVDGRFPVPSSCFYPAPHVDSSVIHLTRVPESEALPAGQAQQCIRVINAAFAQRRKTIRNSMLAAGAWSAERLDIAFSACGIDSARRAETFDLAAFKALAQELEQEDPRS